jgi:type II secretory pathway pseudopilin PulG
MKTQNSHGRSFAKRFNASGMTLIEISLVIALLLGLISVVFLGLGSYRKGADQARCKMQLAAVQKAVRSHANFQNLAAGAAVVAGTDIFVAGSTMEVAPICPSAGTYAWAGTVPAIGTPYGDCNFVDGATTHVITGTTDIAQW